MRPMPSLLALASVLLLAGCDRETAAPATQSVPAALPTAAAPADPAQALLAATRRFANLRSFHAEMILHGARAGQVTRARLDFVAPDRYRIEGAGGVQTVIGDTFFLQGEDRIQQVPVPPGLLAQWRSPLPPDADLHGMAVEDRGAVVLDDVPTRHYLVNGRAGSGETLQYWIGADGLPRQIQRDGFNGDQPFRLTLRYTRLDDPTLQVPLP